MAKTFLKIQYMDDQPPDVMKRQLKELTRYANQAMGELWSTQMLKEHFQPHARLVYKHQQRKWRYRRIKEELASVGEVEDGGRLDSVYEGLLRRSLLRRRHAVKAFPERVTIDMIGPSYWTERPRNTKQPPLAKEVTRVTRAEEDRLAKRADEAFNEVLSRFREQRSKTIS